MQDARDLLVGFRDAPKAFFGEGADADEEFRIEDDERPLEGVVTCRKERGLLALAQFVRRKILTARFHKDERAVVQHGESLKKRFRGYESVSRKAPKTRAAHFASFTVESNNGAFGVLAIGLADVPADADEVAHEIHLTEWNTGLRHAPRSGVHPQQDRSHLFARELLHVGSGRLTCVNERIVDVSNRRIERQFGKFGGKILVDLPRHRKWSESSAWRTTACAFRRILKGHYFP